MGKLILCYVAVALGLQAQENTSAAAPGQSGLVKGSVSAGPSASAPSAPVNSAHFDPPRLRETSLPPRPMVEALTGVAPSGAGIVYTCDSTVTALSPGICTTLNTTIAGLYSAAFTNANATIYVTLGDTTLGNSQSHTNYVSYSTFRNLLMASASGASDITAITDSVPAVNIYGSEMVQLNTALQRALGYATPTQGITPNGSDCNQNGSPGCYDGLITISNFQPLYFRIGTISPDQFDFFTVVEHETDEILGTPSCAFLDCGGSVVDPADYFRYHSNGTRSFGAGANDPCTSSSSDNACFSLDGADMLQQYNNIPGQDAGDWVMNCANPRVQDDVLCAGNAGVDISPTAEILVLDVVGYTLRSPHPAFFAGEDFLSGIVYYLQIPAGNLFGYYEYLSSSILYHFDLGYEAFIPGSGGSIYFYDFASGHWWYSSPSLFPYVYDFTLNAWLYYFPDTGNPGHYTTNPRYFSNLATGQIFKM
jgi:hypothetical protein